MFCYILNVWVVSQITSGFYIHMNEQTNFSHPKAAPVDMITPSSGRTSEIAWPISLFLTWTGKLPGADLKKEFRRNMSIDVLVYENRLMLKVTVWFFCEVSTYEIWAKIYEKRTSRMCGFLPYSFPLSWNNRQFRVQQQAMLRPPNVVARIGKAGTQTWPCSDLTRGQTKRTPSRRSSSAASLDTYSFIKRYNICRSCA